MKYLKIYCTVLLIFCGRLISAQIENTDYIQIITYGQSLSIGYAALEPITITPVANNYMVGNTPLEYYNGKDASSLAVLKPLVAVSKNGTAEQPVVSMVNVLSEKYRAKTGNTSKKFIGMGGGIGGVSIEKLSKECTNTADPKPVYYTVTDILNKTKTAVGNATVSCPAIVYMQGEANYSGTKQGLLPLTNQTRDKEEYKALLLQLKNNMQADIMAQYGQVNKPLFFIYQTGGNYITWGKEMAISEAQYEFAQENEDVVMLNPHYAVSHISDGHLSANGYRWVGEMFGNILAEVLVEGREYKALQPTGIQAAGNTVTVQYHVPAPPLVFDTWTTEDHSHASTPKNYYYGFKVYKNGAQVPISNIAIQNNNVVITCSSNLDQAEIEVTYGDGSVGGRGNLRDSYNAVSKYTYYDDSATTNETYTPQDANGTEIYGESYPLYNWGIGFYHKVGEPLDSEPVHPDTVKVLAIGNSFSEDAVETYLYDIAKACGKEVVIGNAYIAGCSLETHSNNASNNAASYSYRKIVGGNKVTQSAKTISEIVANEDWDYISFQQVSQLSGKANTYFPFLTDLKNYVSSRTTNPNVQFAMHMTWAYAVNSSHSGFPTYNSDQMTMFDSIVNAVHIAAQKEGIGIVIPAGTAIQNARTSSINTSDDFCRDGYHLNDPGKYAAACSWADKLLGVSGCGNVPSGMSATEVGILQTAAQNAVLYPAVVTSFGATAPVISVTPSVLNFGPVDIDSTKSLSFSISNTSSTAVLHVTSLTIDNLRFTSDWSSGSIAAGASQTVNITFAPTSAGLMSGTITILSDAAQSSKTLSVSGTGESGTVPPPVASGSLHYVKSGGSGNGDGSSWSNAASDLQSTINGALNGDTIFVAAGTYSPVSGSSFSIGDKTLYLFGSFAGNETSRIPPSVPDTLNNTTILEGNGNRVIDSWSSIYGVHIEAFRVQGGSLSGTGAGIRIKNGSVSYCTVVGNTATGNLGGGIYAQSGTVRISNCLISNNTSGEGGGLLAEGSNVSVDRCVIRGNNSTGAGGGAKLNTSSRMTNSLVVENHSAGKGGGIRASGGALIYNTTISNNISSESSGGGGLSVQNTSTLSNSIVWGNVANGLSNDIQNTNGTREYSIWSGASGQGNLNSDPLFVNPSNGNYHLQSNSPAIDSGNNSIVNYALDLDGNVRIIDSAVDMGAYEYSGVAGASMVAAKPSVQAWSSGKALFVKAEKAGLLSVYTASGSFYLQQFIEEGLTIINDWPEGFYIIKIGGRTIKVGVI